MSEDSLERLASRLAMLTGEEGEAENAGRAVGAMAHRLGLSGGELKAIFLAGVDALRQRAEQREATPDVEALQAEVSSLRHAVEMVERALLQAERERDELRSSHGALNEMLARGRSGRRAFRFLAALLMLIVAGGATAALLSAGPGLVLPSLWPRSQPTAATSGRLGVVRVGSAELHEQPDASSLMLATLPAGTRLGVKRMVWRSLMQWAEVEVDGRTGYILGTEIDLP